MLDAGQRIRRFTPLAGKALNLIPSDLGTPINDLKLTFKLPGSELNLAPITQGVMETMVPGEFEVLDRNGQWYSLQVRPYRTLDHRIDDIVIALVDIDSLKQVRTEADQANRSKDFF